MLYAGITKVFTAFPYASTLYTIMSMVPCRVVNLFVPVPDPLFIKYVSMFAGFAFTYRYPDVVFHMVKAKSYSPNTIAFTAKYGNVVAVILGEGAGKV